MYVLQPLARNLFGLFKRKTTSSKNDYILYKIVDSFNKNNIEEYKLQCINTNTIFSISLLEMVFDIDILYGLHPVQSCFVGIEYAKSIPMTKYSTLMPQNQKTNALNPYTDYRYGNNNLLYQDRCGHLCFEQRDSSSQLLMDPRDIATTQSLIEEFDAAQAFFIGVFAGNKFAKVPVITNSDHKNNSHLKLVGR